MAETCLTKAVVGTNSVIGNPRATEVKNSGDSFENYSKSAPGKPNNTVANSRMSPAKSNSSLKSPLSPLVKSKTIASAPKASSVRKADSSSSSKSVSEQLICDLETSPMSSCSSPERKPQYTTLTNAIVTNQDLANELLERAEKKQKTYPYPDKMDVLLAAMQNESPVKPPRKEEFNKLDANELLSILEDGAEVHYVEKPSRPRTPRVSRSFYKNIKLDPEVEKRLALKQLMEFTRKRGRPRKSETENNNNNANVNNINATATPRPTSSEARTPKKIKRTPNRELNRLLQDEGAINMLYSIEKGENESKNKLLPSKRRMKKALMKKAQEVTEALLGGSGNSGRHHRSMEKRKLSTDSLDSEHSEFQFAAPSDSRIIRRHSSSSSLSSSRASSPRMSSPPPPIKQEEKTRMSEKTEKLIDAKCKELNLQPEHSQMIKKLIQDKQNGFKERLQSEFASKLRAAISRSKNQDKSGNGGNRSLSPCEMSVWKMVEEDWGSDGGSESDKEEDMGTQNSATQQTANQQSVKSEGKNEQKNGEVSKISPVKDKDGSRLPAEMTSCREISLEVIEGLACLSLETRTSNLPHALTTKVLRELSQALEYVSQSPETKAIAISCNGADFCLGLDLPGLLSSDPDHRRSLAAQAALAIKELACKVCMLGKPLMAGVRGRAVGLGVILLAYCDMVLAEPDATFTAPYPRLACFPEAAATTLLPHVIGLAHTKKLLVSCARLNSAEAEACGLVTKVIPEGLLKERVVAAGKDFMSQSQQIVASTKAVLMHGLRTKIPSVLNTEVKLLQQHWVTEDCQRRIRDLQKNPVF